MMNTEISITGFSSVASIVSLLLADKQIRHTFYIPEVASPIKLRPMSNPLINGPTQKIEGRFIDNPGLIRYVETCDFSWYESSFQPYLSIKEHYNSPVYAIDNRIRLDGFLEKIRHSPYIQLAESSGFAALSAKANARINILGGDAFSSHFKDHGQLSPDRFGIRRLAYFFNLACDEAMLRKYMRVTMLFVNLTGEITLYPFLHVSGKYGLNLTFTVNAGSAWDCVGEISGSASALEKMIGILSESFRELAEDLRSCELLDADFSVLPMVPFYKDPVYREAGRLYLGVGESVTKNDPVIGQGYNAGVRMGVALISCVEAYLMHRDMDRLADAYAHQTGMLIDHLYKINRAFTQGAENECVSRIYKLAGQNRLLGKHILSAFDDISLYFPWLTDQDAARSLIQKYS